MVRALWIVTWTFVAVGVLASILRLMYPLDLVARMEPARAEVFSFTGQRDPFAADRAAEAERFDSRFANHPRLTRVHIVFGALFLSLAPFQFMPSMRRRFLPLHRWSGRLLLVTAALLMVGAFYFGLGMPFAGMPERIGIGLFGVMFLAALARAWIYIRQGRQDLHREWMIRAFAIAIAISTVRVLGPLDLPLTIAGFRPGPVFGILIWLGWLSTIVVAELWIQRTRVDA